MTKKTYIVHGMKCQHCQMSVEGALCDLAGVKEALVSLVDSSVTVDFDESRVSEQELKDAVEGAGRFEMDL